MARLNTRPSSRYDSETPAPEHASDQENHDPHSMRMNKGKGRTVDAPPSRTSLPTPNSDGSSESRGQKRKRVEVQAPSTQVDEDEELDEDEREERQFNKYFDPNQDADERRDIKRRSRMLEREFQESRDDLLRDNGRGLTKTINTANDIFTDVKQTNDATLDSRLLVNVSDLAYKKTAQLVLGDSSTGIDVDEFLSKCITYMRNGGPLDGDQDEDAPPTSRRRRTQTRDESDGDDADDIIGETLDWDFLGRHACFPHNARPCVPSFLLGPLSVEKKHRTQTQRRAREAKDTAGRETRPEALSRDDLKTSDENSLKAICQRINKHLRQHITRARNAFAQVGDIDEERGKEMFKELRVADTGDPSLFEYVLNPRSFGQTVENLFYVSFLIKEGVFAVENDSQGMPTITHAEPTTLDEQRKKKTTKHQAVLSLDYTTWQSLVEAFEVSEPLIPHRQDDNTGQIGERGWYT